MMTREENFEFLNWLGFFVEELEEVKYSIEEFELNENWYKLKLRKFGKENSVVLSQVVSDDECNFFVEKKHGTGTRMLSFDASEQMHKFLFEKYGEVYLSCLDKKAKEEKKAAIELAEESLKKAVVDKELVSAILRNSLTRASKKQILAKCLRAEHQTENDCE